MRLATPYSLVKAYSGCVPKYYSNNDPIYSYILAPSFNMLVSLTPDPSGRKPQLQWIRSYLVSTENSVVPRRQMCHPTGGRGEGFPRCASGLPLAALALSSFRRFSLSCPTLVVGNHSSKVLCFLLFVFCFQDSVMRHEVAFFFLLLFLWAKEFYSSCARLQWPNIIREKNPEDNATNTRCSQWFHHGFEAIWTLFCFQSIYLSAKCRFLLRFWIS